MKERKRRANGKGSAVYLGKGRFKPWCARILIGKDINGKPIYYDIDTFETELDAIVCLENYHKNPTPLKVKKEKFEKIDIFSKTPYPLVPVESIHTTITKKNKKNYTFKQVFEEMKKIQFPSKEEMTIEKEKHIKAKGKFGLHNTLNMITAFNNSTNLYNLIYREIRTSDFQNFINNCNKTPNSVISMIKLYKNMDKFAFQEDIIDKCYATYLIRPQVEYNVRTPFTYEQIKYLWSIKPECEKEELVKDILLLSIYTGCRVEEILSIYTNNIHLNDNYFITGIKTDAGKKREIPIHPKIKHIFEKYYDDINEYLFTKQNKKRMFYANYNQMYRFNFKEKHIMLKGLTAHCGRHTLETELQKLNIKPIIINSIMGHSNGNTGEDIYTHISIEEKIEAIKMVTYKPNEIYVLKTEKKLDKTS